MQKVIIGAAVGFVFGMLANTETGRELAEAVRKATEKLSEGKEGKEGGKDGTSENAQGRSLAS